MLNKYLIKNYDKLKEINKNALELAKKHTYDIRAEKLINLFREI